METAKAWYLRLLLRRQSGKIYAVVRRFCACCPGVHRQSVCNKPAPTEQKAVAQWHHRRSSNIQEFNPRFNPLLARVLMLLPGQCLSLSGPSTQNNNFQPNCWLSAPPLSLLFCCVLAFCLCDNGCLTHFALVSGVRCFRGLVLFTGFVSASRGFAG